jgi:Leucine-rich repeat (LRR) protein
MAQANNGVVIQHVGEAFLTEVDVDEMTRDQLDFRAIRMILDQLGRRNLPAVSASFGEIADRERINMSGSNLRVVPACINLLTGLRVLDLYKCKLNRDDSFPDTLGQLKGLVRLGLYGNNLTSIPSQIGQLSSLTYLDLSYNILVSLPDEIYQLTNLTELVLYNNKLESISEEIGNLTNLTTLWISDNQITKLPKAIGKLVNLENNRGLHIYGNPLTSLPDSIRKVKHALSNISKKEYKLLLEDVETRAAQRLQRRLVILLAKESPTQSTATKDKKISLINDVLKDL